MTLLLNLYLGHLLGDFVLQPGKLVASKRTGLTGLLVHVGIIGLCTAAILYADIASLWNIVSLAIAAHTAIEVVTIRAREMDQLSGLSVFLIDQSLHIASLAVLVWVAEPYAPVESVATFGLNLNATWIAVACALVGVAFMGSIIIFEVVNSIGPSEWNRDILPFDAARVLGMVERGAALMLAVLVHPLLIVLPFLPRVVVAFRNQEPERARQMVVATTGLVVCLTTWILVLIVAMTSSTAV